MTESHEFFKHIRGNRYPSFTSFQIKIFFRTFDYPNSPVLNPVPSRISYLYIAETESREEQERDIHCGITDCQLRCSSVDCGYHTCVQRAWFRALRHFHSFISETVQLWQIQLFVKAHFSRRNDRSSLNDVTANRCSRSASIRFCRRSGHSNPFKLADQLGCEHR